MNLAGGEVDPRKKKERSATRRGLRLGVREAEEAGEAEVVGEVDPRLVDACVD